MSEDRAGEGKVTSPAAAKEGLGRGFLRPKREHEGQRSAPTEYIASKRLAKDKPPTPLEKLLVFGSNRSEVRVLKAAGISDDQIYEQLKDR